MHARFSPSAAMWPAASAQCWRELSAASLSSAMRSAIDTALSPPSTPFSSAVASLQAAEVVEKTMVGTGARRKSHTNARRLSVKPSNVASKALMTAASNAPFPTGTQGRFPSESTRTLPGRLDGATKTTACATTGIASSKSPRTESSQAPSRLSVRASSADTIGTPSRCEAIHMPRRAPASIAWIGGKRSLYLGLELTCSGSRSSIDANCFFPCTK